MAYVALSAAAMLAFPRLLIAPFSRPTAGRSPRSSRWRCRSCRSRRYSSSSTARRRRSPTCCAASTICAGQWRWRSSDIGRSARRSGSALAFLTPLPAAASGSASPAVSPPWRCSCWRAGAAASGADFFYARRDARRLTRPSEADRNCGVRTFGRLTPCPRARPRSSSTSTPASTTRSALLYACASPRARLLGVSTVSGNVDLAQRDPQHPRGAGARRGAPTSPSGRAAPRRSCARRRRERRSMARAASATPYCPIRRADAAPRMRSTRSSPRAQRRAGELDAGRHRPADQRRGRPDCANPPCRACSSDWC